MTCVCMFPNSRCCCAARAVASRTMAMPPVHVTDSAEPLLQSTAGINIIFVNIHWENSEHNSQKSTENNLRRLSLTIASIVKEMKPAVICCCEVGNAMQPMTSPQIKYMMQTFRDAWRADISILHEEGEPYLTAWDGNLCSCKHGRILRNLYKASGMPRTAQAFVCTMPGETDDLGIDVINVHAPSGTPKLKDNQRYTLFRNLLQSSSKLPTKTIGKVKFIIGGDFNTSELTLGRILNELKQDGKLRVNFEVMRPTWGKPGDMCIVGDCNEHNTKIATGTAQNHDPQHDPYGIWWCSQSQYVHLAELIQSHKATPEYEENRRKSGDSRGKSGLTPAELEAKSLKKTERAHAQKKQKKW